MEAKPDPLKLHPVMLEFKELIVTYPVVRLYITEMISQVPHNGKYRKNHLKNYDQMLRLINEVLTQAPLRGLPERQS